MPQQTTVNPPSPSVIVAVHIASPSPTVSMLSSQWVIPHVLRCRPQLQQAQEDEADSGLEAKRLREDETEGEDATRRPVVGGGEVASESDAEEETAREAAAEAGHSCCHRDGDRRCFC
jgi:hypothetical protein